AALLQGRIETVASGTAASGTAQDARRFVGCGKSLPDQRLAIVDPQTRRACAEKQIGEIWVSGPSVAQGYWNRPEENRELFEARLADTGEGPFMRTGDLGFLADGELFITGRLKDLIIIQGQNHYPQDIESTVDAAHPLIRPGCCAAFALGDGPEELVVVAELLPDSPFNLPEAERKPLLKRIAASIQGELFAAHQLAAGRIVLIEAGTIPKTSSGKIQRKACKEALLRHELRTLAELGRNDLEQDPPASGDIPTGTALEDILCGLFADILGLERVGPQERFLDLGGHSLLATRLVSRIRESLGVELPLRLLFETPTVAGLAARIASLEGQPLPPIQALSPAAPLRLSYAQERMWFMDQLQPDSAIYNIPTLIRLEGLLDAPSLEKGFQTLIGRHASLRTRFESRADQVFQIVDAQSDFRLEIVDLCDLADAETEARSLAQAEAHAPFDLAHGPLIRARLLKIRSDLHLLVLNLHHIISDGWSQGLLLQELAACYAAFCQGEAVVLPELPVQYADYAHWQRQNFEGEAFQTQLSYWKGRLADAPARLQLPTDRPRPAVESYQGASFSFRCERALTEALLVLARCEDVTLFMLLLAAFQVLLHRYSRQGDICVGIPIANRRMREIEPLIGFFVNTLVIRGDLQAEPAFRDFLRQIKARCLDAYAHQDLPFEKLVEELNPERSLSHHPLFQVMFVIQDAAMASLQLPGLESSRAELSGPVSKFDLTLELIPGHDGLSGRIEYNRDLFDDTTIARLAGHYIQLLQAIVGQPETPVGSLPLLTEAERRQLLVDWNDTSTKYQRDAWVHRLFEEQTARTPDRTALLWADQRLSYRELNEKANQLAHFLHGQGLGPGMLAGICLERSPDLIAGLLAILKLGAAYVPIDPDYPADRIAWILADAAPALVLSRQSLATRHGLSGLVVDLDAQDVEIARQPLNSPEFTPGELSHVIYTSGSTGRPKGVAIRHSSTTALCQWALGVYSTEELRGVLASTSICFDLSVFEIFVPLSGGGSVVLVQDILELPSCTARSEISLINTVPSAIAQVLKLGAIPASVRTINLAGEPLKTELVSQLYRRTSATKVYDLYGPSEDTTYSTFVLRAPDRPPSIGRPIANTRVYLLDQQLNPVPIGVPGELHLGGAGLAQGYLNRPELTAEKFIPDPFGPPDRPERLYKTGDLARYLPDGNVEFLGRIDHQVKLRGFRIELGEIEALLVQHPDVRDAVVLCRGEAEHKSLIAYLVPDTSAASAELESEQVEQWQALYQETYSQNAAAEPGSDFKGWNSSYTGQPIPIGDMRQWRDATVERILSFKPVKAYEIGCGTGLLLAKIAPSCESYLASDFSAAVVEAVSDLKHRLPGLDRVETIQRRADDFTGITPQAFDTVIINSVIQYFPSAAYLLEVLRQALEATTSGGGIFIGDVRNLDLLQAFHASVTLAKAQGTESSAEIHQQVQLRVQREEELCLAPGFFYSLPALIPGIRQVEVLHKHGRFRNELNCFRYDVILHLGEAPGQNQPVSWLDWEPSFSLEDLPSLYVQSSGVLGIRNIPNARVQQAVQASELLANASDQVQPDSLTAHHETLKQTDSLGYEPEDFWQLGETLNCRVKVCVSLVPDCFSVVFSQTDMLDVFQNAKSEDFTPDALMDLANQPVRGKVSARLVPRLKAALAEKLPEYMIPGRFVVLDSFPLTPNGKIDRKALPDPDKSREQAGSEYVAPSTPEQSLLCELFAEVLELDRVGIHDNFFDLGGHSLLATQLAARIREQLQVELPLRKLFEAPTVARLADGIQKLRGQTGQALPAMQAVSHPGPLRLSCAQERMW
ncbi:MAG TPA: amino acid adenylation domain-containing protein, partial [Candidatus Obscuribacterales bacterium]